MATNKSQFVYVTYISSTPEKVYAALTDPEMTRDYWGRSRNVSDWKPGAAWRHEHYDDPSTIDVAGTVLEADPPRRLVLSWGSSADPTGAASPSRVSFVIEPFADAVKLTVTHDEIEPGSVAEREVSAGWPAILSSLKTLLETGRAMPMTMRRWGRGR